MVLGIFCVFDVAVGRGLAELLRVTSSDAGDGKTFLLGGSSREERRRWRVGAADECEKGLKNRYP